MPSIGRRDFLKLAALAGSGLAASGLTARSGFARLGEDASLPNILVLVFDAMSAINLSLHGYPRRTTPNIERFADRATVFHQHYSPGNFTTPGTASLLTGLHPWTHRAINLAGLIARDRANQNLFRMAGEESERLAFSQNPWPNYYFGQFRGDIETVLSPTVFGLERTAYGDDFPNDLEGGYRAFDDFLFRNSSPPGSLLFGLGARLLGLATRPPEEQDLSGYTLAHVFDGVMDTLRSLPQPWLAYVHLWPPHEPYKPSRQFSGHFSDGWAPPRKPTHRLVDPRTHRSVASLNDLRQRYDEYIANIDAEFGRLADFMQAQGLLNSSYVLITSDHGEMFERGEGGHNTPLLYDPVVRIPLVIAAPNQVTRRDVHVPTSSVDVLPTLARVLGRDAPDWCEGQILPALGGIEDAERSIYMLEARDNSAFRALTRASFALRKGRYKLIDYMGYSQYRVQHRLELYDLREDPQEMNNIYSDTLSAGLAMKDELLALIESVNAPYARR